MKVFSLSLLIFLFVSCGHSENVNSTSPVENELEDGLRVEKTHRLAVISDLNGSYGAKVYNSAVARGVSYLTDKDNKIDFVLSTGDMVAGQKSNLDYGGMWDAFHEAVTRPLLKQGIPVFPSPGNHDAYISRKTERKFYEDRWKKEDPLAQAQDFDFIKGVEQNFPFQYAFKKGTALFIALDNTSVSPWSESTLQWMENIFKRESQSKLRFVYGHIPLLPFALKKEREYVARGSKSFLDRVEKLFEKYKVDAFLSGHSHVYYPGRRDFHTEFISVPLLGSGPRYLISQSSGNKRSQRGLLVIQYDEKGNWVLEHRDADEFHLIDDGGFPKDIRLPSSNSSLCRYCSEFPSSHFLDKNKRIIYRRRDI